MILISAAACYQAVVRPVRGIILLPCHRTNSISQKHPPSRLTNYCWKHLVHIGTLGISLLCDRRRCQCASMVRHTVSRPSLLYSLPAKRDSHLTDKLRSV